MQAPVHDIDLYADDVQGDLFSAARDMRDAGPVVFIPRYGVFYTTRYEVVRAALALHGALSSAEGIGLVPLSQFPGGPRRVHALPFLDPPDHTPLRAALMKVLTPAALAGVQQRLDRAAQALVAQCLARRRVDLVTDVVRPFTVNAIADAFGMPVEGRENLVLLGNVTLASVGPLGERYREALSIALQAGAMDWMQRNCRREALAPDGIGAQIHALADAGEISPQDAIDLVSLFLNGGVDTTFTQISKGFGNFLAHPGQWEQLLWEPGLARQAFDEIMRFNVSVQQMYRAVTRDVDLCGVVLPAGSRIGLSTAGANRDPAKFDDPDRFDVRRRPTGHLGFGSGIHACTGQVFARMEAIALYGAFARAGYRFRTAGEPRRWVLGGMSSFSSLPVEVIGGAAS